MSLQREARADRQTQPPAAPDREAQAFELLIKVEGEGRARLERLLLILADAEH